MDKLRRMTKSTEKWRCAGKNETEPASRLYVTIAGFLYVFVAGIFGLGVFLVGDLSATKQIFPPADQAFLSANQFHFGFIFQLAAAWFTLVLAFALYVVLTPVDRNLALFALLARTAEAALFGLTAYLGLMLADMMREPELIGAGNTGETNILLRFLLHAQDSANYIAITFYAFGSTVFFWLFMRSRFIPSILSVAGIVGTLLIFAWSLSDLILMREAEWAGYYWLPISLTEVLVGFWLMFFGINTNWWWDRNTA